MKTLASLPTWINIKHEVIKKKSHNKSTRSQGGNRQHKGMQLELEELGREKEKGKTLKNKD